MLFVALNSVYLVPFYFSFAVARSRHQMKTQQVLIPTSEANSYCAVQSNRQYPNSKTINWWHGRKIFTFLLLSLIINQCESYTICKKQRSSVIEYSQINHEGTRQGHKSIKMRSQNAKSSELVNNFAHPNWLLAIMLKIMLLQYFNSFPPFSPSLPLIVQVR